MSTKENKCCDKCYSTYTVKTYPTHTVYDACINSGCECHIGNCCGNNTHVCGAYLHTDGGYNSYCTNPKPCHIHSSENRESWEETLWFEVMEDYVMTAELGHIAKDQKLHKDEMRSHFKRLVSHISNLLESERRKMFWRGCEKGVDTQLPRRFLEENEIKEFEALINSKK